MLNATLAADAWRDGAWDRPIVSGPHIHDRPAEVLDRAEAGHFGNLNAVVKRPERRVAVICSARRTTRADPTAWVGRTVCWAFAASTAFSAMAALLRQLRFRSHAVSRLAPILRMPSGVW